MNVKKLKKVSIYFILIHQKFQKKIFHNFYHLKKLIIKKLIIKKMKKNKNGITLMILCRI